MEVSSCVHVRRRCGWWWMETVSGRAGRYRRYTEYLVAAASAIVRQGRARLHRVTLTRLVYLDHVWLVAGHHVWHSCVFVAKRVMDSYDHHCCCMR